MALFGNGGSEGSNSGMFGLFRRSRVENRQEVVEPVSKVVERDLQLKEKARLLSARIKLLLLGKMRPANQQEIAQLSDEAQDVDHLEWMSEIGKEIGPRVMSKQAGNVDNLDWMRELKGVQPASEAKTGPLPARDTSNPYAA